jgi:anaerobic selenocysteine-containing dehydrogenase
LSLSEPHPLAPIAGNLAKRLHIGTSLQRSRIGDFRSTLDSLPAAILADEITTPGERIRALIVIAGDPVSSVPGAGKLRKALGELELLVGIDLFANHTLADADVLLPTTTWLERWDVAGTTAVLQTGGLLQSAAAVAKAPGQTRHDASILADLAERSGVPLLRSRRLTKLAQALPWSRLPSGNWPVPKPRPGSWRRPFHFWHPDLDAVAARMGEVEAELTAPGFTLIGRRRRIGHNSWIHRGNRSGRAREQAWLAPEDLDSLGIRDGDEVEIRTDVGSLVLRAATDDGLRTGTIAVPHGLPGASINDLIPADRIDPLSGQLWMTGVGVEVTSPRRRNVRSWAMRSGSERSDLLHQLRRGGVDRARWQ